MKQVVALTTTLNAFMGFAESHEDVFDADYVDEYILHFASLDDVFDTRAVLSGARTACTNICKDIGEIWIGEITKLIGGLNSMCPAFQSRRSEILSHKETTDAFLTMPQKHVDAIGPVVAELEAQVRSLEKTSNMVAPSTFNDAKSAAAFGRELLVFGLVVRCFKRDWLT